MVMGNQKSCARVVISAKVGLTRARINRRRSAGRERDGSHSQRGLIVSSCRPIAARILGFPNAALGGADQPVVSGIQRVHGQGGHPTAAKSGWAINAFLDRGWPDVEPREASARLWTRWTERLGLLNLF